MAHGERGAQGRLLRSHLDHIPALLFIRDTKGRYLEVNGRFLAAFGTTRDKVIGRAVELFPEELADRAREHERRVIEARRPMEFDEPFPLPDGTRANLTLKIPLLDGKGEVYGTASVVAEVAPRPEAGSALARRVERLEKLREVDGALLGATSPGEVGRAVIAHLESLLDSRRASVALYDFESGLGRLLAVSGRGEHAMPPGESFPLAALGNLDDLRRGIPRVVSDLDELPGLHGWFANARKLGLRSLVLAPLFEGRELIGSLQAWSDATGAFAHEHAEVARDVAARVSQAISHARLLERVEGYARELERRMAEREVMEEKLRARQAELRQLATRIDSLQETERRAIAAELHDSVGQNLAALGLRLNLLMSTAPGERVEGDVRECLVVLDDTAESLRNAVSQLRPAPLLDHGLAVALRQLGEHVARHFGLPVEVAVPQGFPRFPAEVEAAFFRIAQESLTNAAKHAQAASVHVELRARRGGLAMLVADDGRGFGAEPGARSRRRAHWGLVMMRERAQSVGARWRLRSLPGFGTAVLASWRERRGDPRPHRR